MMRIATPMTKPVMTAFDTKLTNLPILSAPSAS
jgi:hypothetical protein